MSPVYDVITIGEILLEVSLAEPIGHGVPARVGVSGDVLNVAAAAAAAGARTAVVAVIPDDEVGDGILSRVRTLGVSDEFIVRRPGQQGTYFVHADPNGQREFSYARTASVGSTLSAADLPLDAIRDAGVVVASGITAAISSSAAEAVRMAARVAGRFAYDPNHRPRLVDPDVAGAFLRAIVPDCWLVTPSYPGETSLLLGESDEAGAVQILQELGVEIAAVTAGEDGVTLLVDGEATHLAAVPAGRVVDQTGAGDAFLGTLTARLALGDGLVDAARLAAAAASLAVGYAGGAETVSSLDAVRRHAERGS